MLKWLRNQSRIVFLAATLMGLIMAAGCSSASQSASQASKPEGQLIVKVLDIGQGDSILIRVGGQVMLVDTGDIASREKLVAYIKKEGISVIDKLILTHPHNDHIGGVAAIFDNFAVKQIYDSGQPHTTATYRKYMETVEKKKIPFALLARGGKIEIGAGATLQIMAPEKPFLTEDNGQLDLNNNSIVAKLVYGSFSMLLTGDTEKQSEARMVKNHGAELKSTLLKVAHHGSNTSSTAEFLKAVAPEAAIVSLGANNDYHHPHPSIVKRYNDQKVKLYRTDQDGTVTISTDGKTYSITKEKK